MRMIHVTVEPPITKDDNMELKSVCFILYFEIEFRKYRTIKGIQCTSFNATKCSHLHKIHPEPQLFLALSLSFLH
jgi:hypothetical protein